MMRCSGPCPAAASIPIVDVCGVVGSSGGVLLSHDLAVAVPSALEGLASGFGMGPGVSPPLWPPEHRTTPHNNSRGDPPAPATPCRGVGGVVAGICTVDASSTHVCGDRCVESIVVSLGVCGASPRPISTSQLETPHGACISGLSTHWSGGGLNPQRGGRPHLGTGFPLRCLQRLSLPNVANQPCPWRDNWHTRGSSVPVLSY